MRGIPKQVPDPFSVADTFSCRNHPALKVKGEIMSSLPPPSSGPTTQVTFAKRECLVVFLAAFVMISLYFQNEVRDFVPTDDDIILITESTPYAKPVDFARWFTTGQSGLWRPYAEYTGTIADDIRPVIDGCFYLNYLVWGDRWGNYLYLNFLVMAAAAAWIYYVCRQLLGLPGWIALVGGRCRSPASRRCSSGAGPGVRREKWRRSLRQSTGRHPLDLPYPQGRIVACCWRIAVPITIIETKQSRKGTA